MAKGTKHRRRGKLKLKFKSETIFTIVQVGLVVFAALILISLSNQGTLLIKINSEITNYIGWGILVFPFLLVGYALLFSKIKSKITRPTLVIGATLIWISLLGITRDRGGVVGSELFTTMEGMITRPGAYLSLVGVLLIGLVVFLNTSLDEIAIFIWNGLKKVIGIGRKSPLKSPFDKKLPLFSQAKTPLEVKGLKVEEKRPEAKAVNTAVPPSQESVKKPVKPLDGTMDLGSTLVSNMPSEVNIWEYPPLSLLTDISGQKADRGDVKGNANIIEKTLESFGITARVLEVNCGPAVTQYALQIALGTKLSKITALANDLALALAAPTGQIRIEAPIPGRSLVGIEIPNRSLEFVTVKTMLSSDIMRKSKSKLTVSLGLDVSGNPLVADLAKMPHMLLAGATGSGKSVCINAFITTLLYRCSPSELKMILVDPKRVELSVYNGIPHLLCPVIVDHEKILSALKWAIAEMDRRYKQFAQVGARNIDGFNELSGFQALPYIVIIIDELADIMMVAPVEVEDAICRIAQMARATGIHLVIATQRPSVNVITGLIKANIPSRITFNVTSMIDSRVIIDMPGGEKLLGRGDMLFIPPDQSKPTRIQGAYISEKDTEHVVSFLKSKGFPVEYTDEVTNMPVGSPSKSGIPGGNSGKDDLFDEAVRVVCQYDRASASLLQRRLSIGYARAARIIDQLEAAGLIGPGDKSKPRDVLQRNPDEFFASNEQNGNGTPTTSSE